MNKAVMISIHPKWCALIANGKKTVEVRKTKPKLETPFKVYIYATKSYNNKNTLLVSAGGKNVSIWYVGNGTVIGEFVCDKITPLFNVATTSWNLLSGNTHEYAKDLVRMACLTEEEMHSYAKGKNCFAWHISNLVIYDEPKEFSEFMHYKYFDWWDYGHHENKRQRELCNLTRPPQSWCYLEEQK